MSGVRRRYRFIKEIAEGGFGKVFLAEQLSSDGFSRIVAVKLLHAKWSSHDEVVKRTRDEARLLGRIRHQHIVKVDDLTSIDGKCAIVMEYLEGVDLKYMLQFLRERGQDFPRAALFEIMIAVCSALDAAYNGRPLQGGDQLRVIHRDIKPSNIFVTINGSVKVLDFGTARANFAQREAETQALAFGSQGYMAPERMLGEEDTPAADVFSLGITLYELLALESYGRIAPRPQKFMKKTAERIASLPLKGDERWCQYVRETLTAMTAYAPSERPKASQLVDIFENLSQGAGDMPLRKFCRTLVAEGKAQLPELDTGDPLTGEIVEEDPSAVFAGRVRPSDPGGGSLPPAEHSAPRPAISGPTGAQISGPSGSSEPTSLPIEPASTAPEPVTSGGSTAVKVFAAAAAVFALLVVVAGVVVVLIVLAMQREDPAAVDPEPRPEVADAEQRTDAEGEASAEAPAGPTGEILSRDTREDVPRSTLTTVTMEGGPAGVIITGGVGFKATWDGREPFELGPLPAASYRANVKPQRGGTIRNKTFEVEADKRCEFSFSVEDQEWTGGCE